ncbi:bis(5'-nucleosyl)-tetraphosphatase (symmetrical) YqeK [Acetonema longum]|uniref:bis(5'-nucleosyl)-tetraphosphatase (symmetrical) n=1 Tax=Acetonema longum DSM 6540 TaxID=1009370 RepID=F7NHR8_9FIRM|nr:bis(5'-nucleosyl)-tetraphosphatase (symmetrical) YqeK [Acetonema longum]EGO64443.1 HD superfamily hydrolase [Acetonema longum DSM 6540]
MIEWEEIENNLRKTLSGHRFQHSVGVSVTAEDLAKRFGADPVQARLAGLLHDCARDMSNNHLLQSAETFGIVVDTVLRRVPELLHAPVGAQLVRERYKISDPAVCQAIARHTVGAKDMSVLDMVIYLADCIEPGRDFLGVHELRRLAAVDLWAAMVKAYDQSIIYIIQQGGLVHPATIEGRNALLLGIR